ncbi:hypothetical protein GGR56DRAFT_646339 [Xylariaceae sp. FL0804]|nr:hypothetical protein GGR56DRAFT_646339 [Xylariaceae sp. FL0804]
MITKKQAEKSLGSPAWTRNLPCVISSGSLGHRRSACLPACLPPCCLLVCFLLPEFLTPCRHRRRRRSRRARRREFRPRRRDDPLRPRLVPGLHGAPGHRGHEPSAGVVAGYILHEAMVGDPMPFSLFLTAALWYGFFFAKEENRYHFTKSTSPNRVEITPDKLYLLDFIAQVPSILRHAEEFGVSFFPNLITAAYFCRSAWAWAGSGRRCFRELDIVV